MWDIETSRLTIKTFNRHPDYIPVEDITEDTFIICGAWKTLNKRGIHSISTLDNLKRLKKNPRDDYEVVKKLRDVISSYDVLIHWNGDNFDLAWLRSRIMDYKLPPLPPIKTIDLYKELKPQRPTSAGLKYNAEHAGVTNKTETSKKLWEGCENGDITSLKKMVRYNRNDVKATEESYNFYKPYIKNNPILKFAHLPECPFCHLNSLHKKTKKINAKGKLAQQYQCQSCGKHITRYED